MAVSAAGKRSALKGFFITIEGIEGSGKTTQIKALGEELESRGFAVRMTREPGGTGIGDGLRAVLLHPDNRAMSALTELFLYAAARAQHVEEVIKPALENGHVLLCDRFSDATYAYQGFARRLDIELVERVNRAAQAGLEPDLTVLLDCPVETGLKRSLARLEEEGKADLESRFEQESVAFHERVREGYLALAKRNPERVMVLDANKPQAALTEEIIRLVLERISGSVGSRVEAGL